MYEPVEALPGGTVAAEIVMGTDQETLFPGLIVSRYGKGKVAYIPAALEAMYRQTRFRQLADFLHDVIRYVSPSEVPYEVDGPATLITNMMARDNTRVLHMINWTGCKYEDVQQSVRTTFHPLKTSSSDTRLRPGRRQPRSSFLCPQSSRIASNTRSKTVYLWSSYREYDNYQGMVVELE